jgi:hypothetical protein
MTRKKTSINCINRSNLQVNTLNVCEEIIETSHDELDIIKAIRAVKFYILGQDYEGRIKTLKRFENKINIQLNRLINFDDFKVKEQALKESAHWLGLVEKVERMTKKIEQQKKYTVKTRKINIAQW